MTKFTSRYRELGFYVGDRLYQFANGQFMTDDPKVIAAISKLTDAVKVEEPEAPEVPKQEKPEAAEQVKKPAAQRKSSAK